MSRRPTTQWRIDDFSNLAAKRLVVIGALEWSADTPFATLDNPRSRKRDLDRRKKLGISHSELKEVLYKDFAGCSALADALSRQNAAVYCLGTYTGSVSDAELHPVTVNYTIRVRSGSAQLLCPPSHHSRPGQRPSSSTLNPFPNWRS